MNTHSNITTAYRQMAQDSYDQAMAVQYAAITESVEPDDELQESKHGFSKLAPARKVKMLSAVIKTIPNDKVPYIIDVIAALANFEQIDEIMKALSAKKA
jgi:hypothetical protein